MSVNTATNQCIQTDLLQVGTGIRSLLSSVQCYGGVPTLTLDSLNHFSAVHITSHPESLALEFEVPHTAIETELVPDTPSAYPEEITCLRDISPAYNRFVTHLPSVIADSLDLPIDRVHLHLPNEGFTCIDDGRPAEFIGYVNH